jgi:ABC-2 type transport system ATP-binding protein
LAGKVILQGERVMVVLSSQQSVDQVLDVIRSAKAKLVALTPHKASLEDLFIRKATGTQQPVEVRV